MSREEPAVYYREIQKNAYLKRLHTDSGKLRPLAHKRTPPKAMWTVFCVHNGRTPYLEQYPEQESPSTLAHRPAWRASLESARHVTASVRPWPGDEYDFLVATDAGPVRMLAPDWESMQDWVSTLRNKLHELKVLGRGENVYCAPPAPPPQRAGTRDPTSPLPPTPVGPAIRVPGIELNTASSSGRSNAHNIPESTEAAPSSAQQTETHIPQTTQQLAEESETPEPPDPRPLEPSDWDAAIQLASQSTTSHDDQSTSDQNVPSGQEPSTKMAKICGQNICLDDSVLKQRRDSDEEFFAGIDRTRERFGDFVEDSEAIDNAESISGEETLKFDERMDGYRTVEAPADAASDTFRQRLVVSDATSGASPVSVDTNPPGTNVTVIKVSNNRGAPHTAIPVVGPQVDVFDFEFKQKLSITNEPDATKETCVSIVNTEEHGENGYGTIFNTNRDQYGNMSLTTTVELTGEKDGMYEKLSMASTSNNVKGNIERLKLNGRKASLPNLDISQDDSNPTYEYLFPINAKKAQDKTKNVKKLEFQNKNKNLQTNIISTSNTSTNISLSTNTYTSISSTTSNMNTPNLSNTNTPIRTQNVTQTSVNTGSTNTQTCVITSSTNTRISATNTNVNSGRTKTNVNTPPMRSNVSTAHSIIVNTTNTTNRNVERSQSQNACDVNTRLLRNGATSGGRSENRSPRRESATSKNDKSHQDSKPTKGLFKRGLTELSFLTRLKGLGQNGVKQPTNRIEHKDSEHARAVVSPVKVVRRSRPDARPADGARRRSTSLSGVTERAATEPVPLRVRQAAALRAEQARGAAVAARLSRLDAEREPPVLCDAHGVVWVAWWGRGGAWFGGRAGDRIAAIRGVRPRDAAHARQLLRQALSSVTAHTVDILFHRVPHAKIYVLYKDNEDDNIGIKLESDCSVARVVPGSAAARAGLPPPGPRWVVTELNNRPFNLLEGSEEEMARLCGRCEEVSVLLQPLPLVQKLRSALKTHRILKAVGAISG